MMEGARNTFRESSTADSYKTSRGSCNDKNPKETNQRRKKNPPNEHRELRNPKDRRASEAGSGTGKRRQAPSGAYAIDLYFTEEDVHSQLPKSNLKSAAAPDGIGFFVYKRTVGQQDYGLGSTVLGRLKVAEGLLASEWVPRAPTSCPKHPQLQAEATNRCLVLRMTVGKQPVKVYQMAYADDLKTVASTRAGISTLRQPVVRFLQWTGLEAKPSKCAILGWKRGEKRQQPDPVQLKLHNEVLPVVKLGKAYKYLGVKGALESLVHQNQILRAMSMAKKDIAKLLRSALLPWQKLDAISAFVMYRLDYHLRYCYPYRQQMIAFDRNIRSFLKVTFKFSKSTVVEMFHQPTSHGGLRCISLIMTATATQIDHAVQMLNSSYSVIRAIAEGQLLEIINKAFIYTPESGKSDWEAIIAYLNGRDLGCLKKRGKLVGVRSLWSELPGRYG
ncbi:hypothetical protein EPH_0052370 [Eimeria praecox]|uniref:Reverse transcriptase domain-containing protein n=1 Tax=Eimeria praecox TaxID=51316 RepID=U6H593_9EIME|nr:hypothetical protein EPH_0052370 [Eimeria praecox]